MMTIIIILVAVPLVFLLMGFFEIRLPFISTPKINSNEQPAMPKALKPPVMRIVKSFKREAITHDMTYLKKKAN